MRLPASLIVVAVALAAVVSAAAQRAASDLKRDSINAFYRAWSEASAQRGPEGYASFFAADGTLLPPDSPPVRGRDAIREWMRKTTAEAAFTIRPEKISVDDVQVHGDWAVYRSTLSGRRIPKAGGESVAFETKYFDVLRAKPDGGWEFIYRMWNQNIPPKPSQ